MRAKREERAVTIPVLSASEGLVLDGLYVAGRGAGCGGVVIAPPHPLYGGSMDSPVVSEVAWAVGQTGRASLRFNWRGCGASGGAPSGEPAAADADYGAAVAHLAETVDGELVAAGYSFGAAAAVRAAAHEPRVRALLLVAPPPALVGELAALDLPTLLVGGELDRIAPADELAELAASHAHARLVRIPEADHFFQAGLTAIGRAVREWLGEE